MSSLTCSTLDEWVGCCAELAGDNARNARLAFIFDSALLSLSPPTPPKLHPLIPSSFLQVHLFYLFPAVKSLFISISKGWNQPCLGCDHIKACGWHDSSLWFAQVGGYDSLWVNEVTSYRFLAASLIPHANAGFGSRGFLCLRKHLSHAWFPHQVIPLSLPLFPYRTHPILGFYFMFFFFFVFFKCRVLC